MFESYNDDGALQFSTEAISYTYYGKFDIPTTHSTIDIGGPMQPADIKYTGCGQSWNTGLDHGGATDFIVAGVTDTNTPSMVLERPHTKIPATVTCYVFCATNQIIPPDASGYGLQTFDENGELTYDSNYKILRVVDRYPNPNIANGASQAVTLPGGRTYAWAMFGTIRRSGFAYPPPSPYNTYEWYRSYTVPGVRKNSATSFTIEPLTCAIPGVGSIAMVYDPSSISPTASLGGVMAIDVTGLGATGIPNRYAEMSPLEWQMFGTAPVGVSTKQFTCNTYGGVGSDYNFSLIDVDVSPGSSITLTGQVGNKVTVSANLGSGGKYATARLKCDLKIDGISRTAITQGASAFLSDIYLQTPF